jgi:hypothetical protein
MEFLLDDWSSSSDSDLEDDDTEQLTLILAVKEMQDKIRFVKRRRGSISGRLCIPRNRSLSLRYQRSCRIIFL